MTAMPANDDLAGAGGTWARHDEVNDPQVRPQAYADSCGPACGALTFLLRSLLQTYLEEELYDSVGRQPASVTLLADAMNRAVPPSETATWAGEAVDVDQEQLTQILARYTPWIAHVREQQNLKANGHFVVVTRIEDAHVQILDPWDPGTAYHMKTECFLAHWTLELVWPKRIP